MPEDNVVEKLIQDTLGTLRAENLFVEAMRDLVKDEMKAYVRARLEANPELKAEIREAVRGLLDAKLREGYAYVKLAKAGAKLGLELVPPDMRQELAKELSRIIEKEVGQLLERSE